MNYNINFITMNSQDVLFSERLSFIPRVGDTILGPFDRTYKVQDVIYKPSTVEGVGRVLVIIKP